MNGAMIMTIQRKDTKLDRFLDKLDQSISGEDIIVFTIVLCGIISVAIFY